MKIEVLKNISKELGIPILTASQKGKSTWFAPARISADQKVLADFPSTKYTGSCAPIEADGEDSASCDGGARKIPYQPSPSPKHYRFRFDGEKPIGIGNPDHLCEEGMTEIFGWMICKHCGKNLRQIK